MLEKIKIKIIDILLKKYILGYVVKAYDSATGYKTQIFLGLTILTWIAESFQVIQPELAKQLYEVFGVGGGMSLLQKLKRYQPIVDTLAGEIRRKP